MARPHPLTDLLLPDAMCGVVLLVLLSAMAWVMPLPAQAAESYDNCAGHYIDSLPATISTQGTWCLRHDLSTAISSGAAISITTNNVTIDCNGFKVGGLAAGLETNAFGILASDRQNISVRGCNVRGFYYGIVLQYGAGHVVEDNRLDGNVYVGIDVVGDNNRVRRNAVYATGGYPNPQSFGIAADADLSDNIVSGVFASGTNTSAVGILVYGDGHTVRDNRVRGLAATGTGIAKGIDLLGVDNLARDNTLSATGTGTMLVATPGYGINHDVGASANFCGGNTIASFATGTRNCQDIGGNAYH